MSDKVVVLELQDNEKYQKLLEGHPQTCGMRSGKVRLEPEQSCGEHSTNSFEEMLVFLAGKGQLLINKNTAYEVGRGKISYIPPQTIHDVKNTGDEALIYTYCVVPVDKS